MRVWVPLRNQMTIGMVMRTHDNRPDFETKEIAKLLDTSPILADELLKLVEWVHRFYYASPGEAVQAALPAGLNFIAEPRIRVSGNKDIRPPSRGLEKEIYDYLNSLDGNTDISLNEISKRWQKKGEQAVNRLASRNVVEIWQLPRIRMKQRTVSIWDWSTELPPPTSFKNNNDISFDSQDALIQAISASALPEDLKIPKWVDGLRVLYRLPLPATRDLILDQPGITPYVWKRILDTGLLTSKEVPEKLAERSLPFEPDKISALNEQQEQVVEPVINAVRAEKFKRFLLYGVTGSGKTEIYIHALRETLNQGRGGLVLVPEIALTPQTVRRFHQIFGNEIAVLHSRLSDRERFDAWTSLQKGEKKIAIGARSAVFAPVQNPGLIIIDEEHDGSYKQEDPAPRYHARETAVMRAYYNDSVIITGSATPSLVSLQAASSDKCTMLQLDSRHALARMPEVQILDLKQYRNAMHGPMAIPLFQAVEEALIRNEQIILLHNRRGFSTFIQCDDCGQVVECPHCSVSLTYHKTRKHLRCHYCGYSALKPHQCPSCDSHAIGELGMGTQKVESELEACFPDARIARMDQDTTSGKGAHEKILQRFANGQADILMGTQIVAKGLDFPNVTVVGVINSDTELAFPSYRSSERMYQLLSQVAGRSGRSTKPGKVFLQTLMPDHSALQFARQHDFPGFARQEMKSRRKLNYPPYSRLIKIFFKSTDEQLVADIAARFTEIVSHYIPDDRVMGPSPSSIARMKKSFQWESHLKILPDKGAHYIEQLFDTIFHEYDRQKPKSAGKVRISVNVDSMH